jgi:hypothetical protein
MGTKSREVIWGGQVRASKINAESARQHAREAVREADRAEAHAGRYAWKASVALRSRRQQSANV